MSRLSTVYVSIIVNLCALAIWRYWLIETNKSENSAIHLNYHGKIYKELFQIQQFISLYLCCNVQLQRVSLYAVMFNFREFIKIDVRRKRHDSIKQK